jgi:hypothetical protein
VTVFNDHPESNSQEIFLQVLDDVDLHHGENSVKPPYSELVAIGVRASDAIRSVLTEIRFEITVETADGFIARRKGAD